MAHASRKSELLTTRVGHRAIWSAAAEGLRCFTRSPGDAALAPRGAGGSAAIVIGGNDRKLKTVPVSSKSRFLPVLPLRGGAKAASPGLLVKHRSPSAAALHMVRCPHPRCEQSRLTRCV